MTHTTRASSEYSATLTGNPFLFFETRLVARRILDGDDQESIESQVISGNLFQYKSTKSLPKRVKALFRRLDGIDRQILDHLVFGAAADGKIITLLLIARSDRLFREFLLQVLADKRQKGDDVLADGDVYRYFETKAEISPSVAAWKDSGLKKLREVYINILSNAGILKDIKSRQIQSPILDLDLRLLLMRHFTPELLRAIEG